MSDEEPMLIKNLIPVSQKDNQNIRHVNQLLRNLPKIHGLDKNTVYSHVQYITTKMPKDIRIDVIRGLHTPAMDGLHFNIAVYDRRVRPNELIYENLHVYIIPHQDMETGEWSLLINPYMLITA